jgi:predicted pyridoxine 5'-phosphate oxidase superfamily flavin-nucleotide-binding protein
MAKLPQHVVDAWEKRQGPIVLATVDGEGKPNVIYASCVNKYDDSTVVVADNFFDTTKKNILSGSTGSVLFLTDDNKAFQIKGVFEYHEKGEIFDHMKRWNPGNLPGRAAAALKVREVYCGADKLL